MGKKGAKPGGKNTGTEMSVSQAKKISKATSGGEKPAVKKSFMSGKKAK
jgi:hypothetical protein